MLAAGGKKAPGPRKPQGGGGDELASQASTKDSMDTDGRASDSDSDAKKPYEILTKKNVKTIKKRAGAPR